MNEKDWTVLLWLLFTQTAVQACILLWLVIKL